MKNTIIFSTALIFLFNVSNAQVETFDLSDFKLPYLRYETLDFDFGLNSQNQFESWKDTIDYNILRSNITSRFNLGSRYQLYINTPSQQSNYSLITGFQTRPFNQSEQISSDESSVINRNSRVNFQIGGSSRNRFYNRNNMFLEIGPNINLNYYFDNAKNTQKDPSGNISFERTRKNNDTQLNAGIEIGVGFGRIEYVGDAQMALFILKDLKKKNRLEKEPTHQEIYELAELISRNRNRRFFDNRHLVIAQIQSIDSLLLSRELVSQADATYFTTIYDNWLYANNPSRPSGFRISAGPKVGYMLSVYNESEEYTDSPLLDSEFNYRYSYLDYGLWVNANSAKPLNHFWQQNLSVTLSYILATNVNKILELPREQRRHNELQLSLSATYGYYPDTRSYVSFGIQAGWHHNTMERYFYPVEDFNYDDEDLIYDRIFAGPNFNGYYYFSPRFRFNFNGSVNYNFHKTDNFGIFPLPVQNGFSLITHNRLNVFVNAGFTYALF